MTNQTIVETSITATATLSASVVIFDSPVYIYLAVISGFVGMMSSLNDLDEVKKLNVSFYAFFTAFKGAFIGFFSAPLLMMFLVLFGNQVAEKLGFSASSEHALLIYMYWGISILFSRVISKRIFQYLDNGKWL